MSWIDNNSGTDRLAPLPGLSRAGVVLVGLLALLGCAAVGPDYVRPAVKVPEKWTGASSSGQTGDAGLLAQWWKTLDDPVLSGLIGMAVDENLDVKEARSRVREARYRRLQSRAPLFPSLDATASARKSASKKQGEPGMASELYTAGFDAGWELDFFGGARRSVEAYQADLEAGIEDLHDVMVTLLSEVAVNYIDLRTYQARLAVARGNVAAQKETWDLLLALSRSGMGDELAVTQARYNLESSRAKIPDLEVGLEAAVNRLAVLTGRPAGSLQSQLAEVRPIPRASIELAVGVPADVIRQRPDIRRAERELAAQTARIGEAEAERYPKFTLNGSIGLEALSFGDLFSSANRTWSIGPSFSWPVIDGGAVRNNINIQTERRQQALIRYNAAILSALEEVENALVTYAKEQQKLGLLQNAADAARSAAELAGYRYATGMIGFSDVLDAQRSLLSFEDQVAQSRGAVLSDLVRLYKALGGGWQSIGTAGAPNPSQIGKG
ncbi:MAG: efflux transporter outer membrane subunit [Desulfobacterales bacterium]|jgi:NodT family efflux transporter outer membrane factor (OMF) lipoprotein